MKISSNTLRTFTTVHTWVGLVAGFALFVAFYAGAITMFHHELQAWQSPHALSISPDSLDDAQRLLDETLARHPASRKWLGMLFPGEESPKAIAYWPDEKAVWHYATLDTLDGTLHAPHSGLSELINALHFSLGIPVAGIYLMGIISLLYGVALISGLIIHLPSLVKDLFALRPGRNLKRFWQDAHNVIGVLSLPMHLMFAITGAMLCLVMLLAAALNPLVYGGKLIEAMPAALDTAPAIAPANQPATAGSLAHLQQRAIAVAKQRGLDVFEPAYLKLVNGGDANAVIEITGEGGRSLGPLGSVALNAHTGELLATQLPGSRDANHATLASAYALHFGEYGNGWVRWLYFLLGVGGAFLFYSGNLLWIESRRKRRQNTQGRAQIGMAKATVGICIGVCVAISVAFISAPVLERYAPPHADAGLHWACFVTWAACASWAALRAPARAARELLWAAAISTALVPVVHGALTGAWWWNSAKAGQWSLFAIDAGALALAFGFAVIARVTTRRARTGDPNSVWAEPGATGRVIPRLEESA